MGAHLSSLRAQTATNFSAQIEATQITNGQLRLAISFPVQPGFDHFVEYRNDFDPTNLWTALPDAPHNSGVVYDTNLLAERFYRVLKIAAIFTNDCPFPTNLASWTVVQAGGSPSGAGGVIATNCEAVMTEGDSFLVSLEGTFIVPAGAGLLSVSFVGPAFDTSSTNQMHDAFEAALVEANGLPLTFTIEQGDSPLPASAADAAVFPPYTDCFFNQSKGSAPFVAPGSAFLPSTPDFQHSTVACDVRQLVPGRSVRLLLRLVNNDRDHATTVRISSVGFAPFNPSLDLTGSPPPAFALLQGSTLAAGLSGLCQPNFNATPVSSPKIVYGTVTTNVINGP